MRVLLKPELEKFVEEKVRAGQFPNPEAVVEDALVRMMRQDVAQLTQDDVAAINSAEEEMDRGEHVEFETFAEQMRQKYGVK